MPRTSAVGGFGAALPAALVAALGVAVVLLLPACPTVDLGEVPPDPNVCRPDRSYYETEIWPNFLAPTDPVKSCVAQAGLRLVRGAHRLEPEVARSLPTFDGDSIWNVFVVGASWDARLTYDLSPRLASYRGFATGWLRRYDVPSPGDGPAAAWVAGLRAGAELAVAPRVRARLDLLGDDGYGGRRLGATATARWERSRALALSARAGGLAVTVDDTDLGSARGVSGVGQVAARWAIDPGIAVHATGEVARTPRAALDARVVAVLELTLEPETR